MGYILDSNALEKALRHDPTFIARLNDVPEEELYVSIVTAREKVGGLLNAISKAESKQDDSLILAYDFYQRFLHEISYFQIYPYTREANALFRSWGNWKKAIGANDCRIAAVALTGDLTVITSDGDFEKIQKHVPELVFEDWGR